MDRVYEVCWWTPSIDGLEPREPHNLIFSNQLAADEDVIKLNKDLKGTKAFSIERVLFDGKET